MSNLLYFQYFECFYSLIFQRILYGIMTKQPIDNERVGVLELVWGRWFLILLEGILGAHLGALGGWIVGFFAGKAYCCCFRPFYTIDFDQINYWSALPSRCAIACLWIGIIPGILWVFYTSWRIRKKRRQKIQSLQMM